MIKLTLENFISFTQNELVLVLFGSQTCAPCKMTAKILEIMDTGSILKAKVMIEDSMDLAKKYKVEVLPTLVLMDDGHALGNVTGLNDKLNIQNLIDTSK